ncbi:MAG: hypothetical protein HYX24_03695 [Candidatus Aenigmarchaeota archaeon]|nr:hypothetical protein [Candidatus Aenigmarchaeota archaeon]
MMRLKGRANPAIFKAVLPLEYAVKFIIMLVALSVIAMIIINFQSLYPQPAPDDKKPLEAFPIIQNKSQFTGEEVARNIEECHSALSGLRPNNLVGKVCYIMQSGQDFGFVTDPNMRPLLNPNLPVEYNISPESKILTVLFDFTGRKIVLRSQSPERPASAGSKCAGRNESCSGAQCCRNLFCREDLSGEGKSCCKSTECSSNGICTGSGTCASGNVCVKGAWKPATPNETICNDGIDNDCDGLTDMRDLDCILKSSGQLRAIS